MLLGASGDFYGFVWPDDAPATVVRASVSAPHVSHSCLLDLHRACCAGFVLADVTP